MEKINTLINTLQDLPLAIAISEDAILFPWIESIHVLAIAIVIGTIFLIDFRLVGIAFKRIDLNTFSKALLKFTWIGFGIAVITGSLLFISNANTYFSNTAFELKFLFMFLAGINMLIFQTINIKGMQFWGAPLQAIPLPARLSGLFSLIFWFLVIVCGRWIGFTI